MRSALILCGSLWVIAAAAWPEAAVRQAAKRPSAAEASRADARKRLVGTWKLVTIERFGPGGELLPPPLPPAFGSPNSIGFLVYDAAGYMGMTIMQSDRPRFAGTRPTAAEAKTAVLSYLSVCGTFSASDEGRVVTHHVQTSLNPNDAGTDQKNVFELSDNRLTLRSPRGADGIETRSAWERQPDSSTLTPLGRRLIGFWKQVGTERRTFDGRLFRSEPPRVGYLIFTAAGHMAVHLMDPGRKKYAAADPTPEEAQQTLSSYANYFGPYEVSDAESYEVTRQVGTINPTQGDQLALRRLTFVGNRVILKPPPAILDGQLVQGYVTWERVTPRVGSTP